MAFFFKNTRTKVLPLLNLVRYLICSELVAESKADTMADTRINLGTTSSTRSSQLRVGSHYDVYQVRYKGISNTSGTFRYDRTYLL